MAIDLTKMVEDWYAVEAERDYGHSLYTQAQILKAMAAEIEANTSRVRLSWEKEKELKAEIEDNREEIERLKEQDGNPYLLNEEEIERMRIFMAKR